MGYLSTELGRPDIKRCNARDLAAAFGWCED
jgi:hypothetical protein